MGAHVAESLDDGTNSKADMDMIGSSILAPMIRVDWSISHAATDAETAFVGHGRDLSAMLLEPEAAAENGICFSAGVIAQAAFLLLAMIVSIATVSSCFGWFQKRERKAPRAVAPRVRFASVKQDCSCASAKRQRDLLSLLKHAHTNSISSRVGASCSSIVLLSDKQKRRRFN